MTDMLAFPSELGARGVRLIYLFGSQATGAARPDSDVDLAVVVDDRLAPDLPRREGCLEEVGEHAARQLGRAREDIGVQDMDHIPVGSRAAILEKGKLLFEAEPGLHTSFFTRTLGEVFDLQPMEEFFQGVIRRRLREGTFGR